jgi:methionyl-tRNA formyltransferase
LTSSSWRIVFFGSPAFAIPSLEQLLQGPDEVVAVVTQPDRARGRGLKVIPCPVKELALKHGLNVLQPEKVREEGFQREIEGLRLDLFVVVAYGQILPGSLLEIPRYGAVNVHASLLPEYRGAAPIAWAILKGEKLTGVTTMVMDEGMDTGDILLKAEFPISVEETNETLRDQLALLGAQLLIKTLREMREGNLRPVPQDHSKATYAPPLKKEDGRIDWNREAKEIDRRVRALNPWPGTFTRWNGRLLKIFRGAVREGVSREKAGRVSWAGSDFIEVETGKDFFLIKEVQLEGKKRMSVREFLAGHPISAGTIFH